ncbi:hypothetical protein G9A89_023406 [Geosiphon pyriformis]|nr:hypothetical protein G9A89_023406 [Geosiphon pyriformis]
MEISLWLLLVVVVFLKTGAFPMTKNDKRNSERDENIYSPSFYNEVLFSIKNKTETLFNNDSEIFNEESDENKLALEIFQNKLPNDHLSSSNILNSETPNSYENDFSISESTSYFTVPLLNLQNINLPVEQQNISKDYFNILEPLTISENFINPIFDENARPISKDDKLLKILKRNAQIANEVFCSSKIISINKNIKVLVLPSVEKGVLTIAFYGDEKKLQKYIHDQTNLVPFEQEANVKINKLVSESFSPAAVKSLLNVLNNIVLKFTQGYTFNFTGFSMGGVYALLAAIAIQKTKLISRPIVTNVYTYGMPRIGNQEFVLYAESMVNTWRVTYADDYVPRNPVKFENPAENIEIQYQHPGKEIWIKEKDNQKAYSCPFMLGESNVSVLEYQGF